MKLIAPNVGWASSGPHSAGTKLFWTTDGGNHWKEITPNSLSISKGSEFERDVPYTPSVPEFMADVFFLDTRRGWVLFCCGDPTSKQWPQYDLAMTKDAGTTWSIARLKIPDRTSLPISDGYIGGRVAFADSLHGWITLTGCATHSCSGALLSTSDGGRTWRAPSDEYVSADPFCLIGPTQGWQLSLPGFFDGEGELNFTRDGAKSWHQVSLPFPKLLSADAAGELPPTAFYHDLPIFEDSEHGFLPVTYLAENADGNSAIVLFETVNRGKTWKPVRTITHLYIPGVNASYTVAVADSTLITAVGSRDNKRVTLSRDGTEGRADTDITNYIGGWRGLTYLQLSFATPKKGWMGPTAHGCQPRTVAPPGPRSRSGGWRK